MTAAASVAGAGLLIASGAIHFDLYLTGYRTIPVIGWLFLAQVIAAFTLGLAVLAIPARLVIGRPLAAGAGAGLGLATLGGYLLSVWPGLFGFTEVRTAAGIAAGLVEAAGFAVLITLALAPPPAGSLSGFPATIPAVACGWAAAAAAALGAAALGAVRGGGGRRRCCGPSGRGHRPGQRHRPEDHDHRRHDGPDQRRGLHALPVRP